MFRTLILSALLISSSQAKATVGNYLDESQNPQFSCLIAYVNQGEVVGLCSGEAVGNDKFLTAAHCEELNRPAVVLCPNKQQLLVKGKLIHPDYAGVGNQFDQALLQVESNFDFSPISLPNDSAEVDSLLKEDCAIFGYGLDSSEDVGKLLGIPAEFNNTALEEGMIGLGGTNFPRQGDSGGGLICREDVDSPWVRLIHFVAASL